MRRRELLALMASSGTGGCLRLASSGSSTPSPVTPVSNESPTETAVDSETRTPTSESTRTTSEATETPTDTEARPEYPTGLSTDGVSPLLYETHKRELAQTSFHTEFSEINLQKSEIKKDRSYDVDTGLAIGSWAFDRGGPVTMYRSSQGGFWREELGDRFTYGEGRRGYSIGEVTWKSWLVPALTTGEWGSPTASQQGAHQTWEVETTGFDAQGSIPGYWQGQLEGLSASMVVDARGIIRSMTTEFDGIREEIGSYNVRFEYSVDSVGEVSVTEPAWLSTAQERRPQVTAELTSDRNFVRFTLDSGNQLEPATGFTVYDEQNRWNAINYRLEDPIEPGDTVYLYKEQEGPFNGQIARGSRPSDASPVSLANSYHMWASRSLEYFGTVEL